MRGCPMPVTLPGQTAKPPAGPDPERGAEILAAACAILGATKGEARTRAEARLTAIAGDFRRWLEEEEASPYLVQSKAAFDRAIAELGALLPHLRFGSATFNPRDYPGGGIGERAELETEVRHLLEKLRARRERWQENLGRNKPYTMTEGPTKRRLALACRELWSEFRADAPTSTVPGREPTTGGDFYKLVAVAYELATGKYPENEGKGTGLRRAIETTLKTAK